MPIQITGDSPEAVAYRLMEMVALQEHKPVDVEGSGANRAYILSTYKECLTAVLAKLAQNRGAGIGKSTA
jgi:hypothetical protein